MVSALLQYANRDAIYGNPATVGTPSTDDLWANQYGLDVAIDATNTYAGIDRTLAANYWWRSGYDTAAHNFSLEQLYADMHLTKGISFLNGKIDVLLVGPSLFAKYQREIMSYHVDADPDGKIRKLRELGYEGMAINYNGMYVLTDNRIAPKTGYGLNSKSWIFATKSGYNFKFGTWKDQTEIEGGKQAFYGLCDVQYMLICEAPMLNVKYTNLT